MAHDRTQLPGRARRRDIPSPTTDTETLGRLSRIVGDANVLIDPAVTTAYATDWTQRWRSRDIVVVRPGSAREAVECLRVAGATDWPVQLQGGNTGLVGGSHPLDRTLLISTSRLRRLDLDNASDGFVVADAGVTLAEMQQAVRPLGWDPGIDMASRDLATVGGMVATNAGGVSVLAHGMTAARAVSAEVFSVIGDPISTLHPLIKDNAGPRLDRLLIGSEGTLGMITKVAWRLVPWLPSRLTVAVPFADLADAVAFVRDARRLPGLIAAEAWDQTTSQLAGRAVGNRAAAASSPGWTVLAEYASGQVDEQMLAPIAHWLDDAVVATDGPGRRRLWAVREDAPLALTRLGVPVKADISLPLAGLAKTANELRRSLAAAEPDWLLAMFGHLGDGNLHLNAVGDGSDNAERAERFLNTALEAVLELGGAVSAEHGLGRAKAQYLAAARPAEEPWLRRLKDTFDPDGRLNQGVLGLG